MIDDKDRAIIDALIENSRASAHDIARRTGIPLTTVHNRIKRLEQNGIVKQYTAIVDDKALGRNVSAQLLVSASCILPNRSKISQADLAQRIKTLPEVHSVYGVIGSADMTVHVTCESLDVLHSSVLQTIKDMGGVDHVQTLLVLERY